MQGRFVENWEEITISILNHLSKQLEIELVHKKLVDAHKNTESRIRLEIKKFLGFQELDFKTDILVSDFLAQNPVLISNKNEITKEIEKFLIKAKVILPSKSQLMRFVYSKYGKTQIDVFKVFASKITEEQKKYLYDIYKKDILLSEIKKPIGEVNIKNITPKIETIESLLELKLEHLPWKLIHPSYSEKLTQLIHKYEHSSIKRIKPAAKRDVMMICYLHESSKTMMDLIINSYDKLMGEIERRVNRDFEIEYKKVRNNAKTSSTKAISTLKLLKYHKQRTTTTLDMFCEELKSQDNDLDVIIDNCEKVEEFEIYGKSELAQRRYSYLTKFLQKFLDLKFKTAKGCEYLMRGIDIYRNYHKTKKFSKKVPYGFMENPWKKALHKKSGGLNRKAWEIGLFFAVKKGLKSGNLYLPQSKYYRDFWAPLYNQKQWNKEKEQHYKELNAPEKGEGIIVKLKQEFSEQLYLAVKSFGHDGYAEIKNNRLVIHKDDPLPESNNIKELKGILSSYIEPIRIENLLSYIQKKTNYMSAFRPIEGVKKRELIEPYILNAAITGHATNLGLYGISRNCRGITGDKLSYVSNYHISADNLKEASNILIAAQQNYWLTKVIGSGDRSTSDGQRFRTNHKGLYSSMHPRYFGALDRGITIYTHMSDQCSVFNTEILSCAVREAVYVLDGLLDNQSVVRPFEHSTDTAGFTEVVFALCYLLGISFQPHFKDLKDQQLYCFNRKATNHPELFSKERPDDSLICEQWDDMTRLVYSLKKRLIKPHIIIQKLHAQETFTKLAKALVHLGRIVKTTYILRYFHDEKLRYIVRKQLNRGELRHTLARYVFFADQGSFKTNDYEEMMNKASSLSFVSNAMVLWNTEQIQNVYEILDAKGYKIEKEDMARVLPLSTKNILVHGTYSFKE
jgi:TnpA family transposase/predicted DNA-binding protein YlxM (UPF0122 family)